LKGDMSFAGPRPLAAAEAMAVPVAGLVRFWIRPGLVSAHWLRKGIGVAYESEHHLDRDFYYGQSFPRRPRADRARHPGRGPAQLGRRRRGAGAVIFPYRDYQHHDE
jgi:hypothetical protein